jgi:hypothetical protein
MISPEMVTNWLLSVQNSTDYLHIDSMIPGMAYAIWSRNAHVGIWLSDEKGFLISRYKVHPIPFLFVEYHWDMDEPLGTAKPLRPLGKCPLPLPSLSDYRNDEINSEVCCWLDALEEHNPPLPGWDSVGERRQSGAEFLKRLARPSSDKSVCPIWRIELDRRSSD